MCFFRSFFVIACIISCPSINAGILVDTSGRPCKQEIDYIKSRQKLTQKALDIYAGKSLSKYPRIGLCLSGGGYRALISTLGFVLGAQQSGLLDAANYMATLSGSTWNIGTMLTKHAVWKAAGKNDSSFLKKFRDNMQKRLAQDFWNPKTLDWKNIIKKIEEKFLTYNHLEPADLWGGILINRLMGDLPQSGQNYTFSSTRNFLKKTIIYPFPLFTAVIKDTFDETNEYEWFEVSPFASGSNYLDGFIPTRYLGSVFENGESTSIRPEETLGYLFGIFGSPYDINAGDLLLQLTQLIPESFTFKYTILTFVHHFIKKYKLDKTNVLPSPINNPTYKMESSPHANELITLADAGFDFTLPFPPLLKRNVDIIICCDAATDAITKGFPELKMAQRYAQRYSFRFPSLKYAKKICNYIFIFDKNEAGQTDPKIPTIIYCINPSQESTFKLQYSEKEFNTICDFIETLVAKNKKVIAQAIIEKSDS
ncbi:MAG: hypothetical protein V1855_01880 [bacterium]